jgi:hypothetical protein
VRASATYAAGGLRAIAEAAIYSPVWVLPVLLIVGSLVPPSDSWWVERLQGFRSNPTSAFTVVGLLVILRPAILSAGWLLLVTVGIVIVRHSWAEKLGSDLVDRIRRGQPAGALRAEFVRRLDEGNADAPHVDALMWAWVVARYENDRVLEAECARRIGDYVLREPLKDRAIVWCLRAWAQLGRTHGHLLPPICAPAVERRR